MKKGLVHPTLFLDFIEGGIMTGKRYKNKELFRVGKIVNTQGLGGELRLISTSDFPDRFAPGLDFIAENIKKELIEVKLKTVRLHKNFILVSFAGYEGINEVIQFKTGNLYVTEENLAGLDDGEYYFHQLIGLQVVDEGGNIIGKIKDILQTGANDVYVVARDGKSDLLLPVIDECVLAIDLESRTVRVHVLEGLE